jgi:predicted transposase/invertase (TIGR01784 family)
MLLAEYDYDTDIAVQRREAFDDGISIGLSQGRNEGARDAKIETAKSMKLENMPISMIAHFTGLSPEEIEKL